MLYRPATKDANTIKTGKVSKETEMLPSLDVINLCNMYKMVINVIHNEVIVPVNPKFHKQLGIDLMQIWQLLISIN